MAARQSPKMSERGPRPVEGIAATGGEIEAARLREISRVTRWKLLKGRHIRVEKMIRG
jgi:hypothetical protein